MKKNASILIIAASFFFAISAYFFFSFSIRSNLMNTSEMQLIYEEKPTSKKGLQNEEILKTFKTLSVVIPQTSDTQQKIDKAIHNIKKKSRAPTGQLKIDAEFLRDHEAFQGTRWKLLSKVRAVLPDQILENDIIVGQMSRFQLVEVDSSESSLNQFDRSSPLVVYETRLKKPGIVTGLIKVETEQKATLELALFQMNAHISDSFDQIQTYFVTSEQTVFDLEKLYLKIKSLSYVRSVELDILDRAYEKR